MRFSYLEKKVFKQGCQRIAGIDEVGYGSLAGPVASAVVVVRNGYLPRFPRIKIGDSKQLSPKQREEVFELIKQKPNIEWRVSFVWPQVIDRVNILRATQLTWRRCLNKLNQQPDFCFLDGNQELPRLKIGQQAVLGGDGKIFLISLASIIAKVSRDKLMEKLSQKYPEYNFVLHKGYGTKLHLERLKKFGPSEIHRKSFRPVFDNLTFRDKVYYAVSKIPKGQVMTYKGVAEKIGHPKSYRAVGNALNKNINSWVPCHRVIRSDGRLGGFRGGGQKKKELLKREKALK